MNRLSHRHLGLFAALLGGGALAAGAPQPNVQFSVPALASQIEAEQDHISALDLGESIMRGDDLLLFDLRPADQFAEFSIPTARNATLESLLREPVDPDQPVVLYSEGGPHAAQAWVLLRATGLRNVYFLREGLYEWIVRVNDPRLAIDATEEEEEDYERAEELSRFFGGSPRRNVPREEVPAGYWTDPDHADGPGLQSVSLGESVRRVRRRGC